MAFVLITHIQNPFSNGSVHFKEFVFLSDFESVILEKREHFAFGVFFDDNNDKVGVPRIIDYVLVVSLVEHLDSLLLAVELLEGLLIHV